MLVADLGDAQEAERRVFGGFQYQRVARGDRHRNLECAEHDRRIPWHDAADDTNRLAARVAQDVLAERNRLPFRLARKTAVIPDDLSRALDLGACLRPD